MGRKAIKLNDTTVAHEEIRYRALLQDHIAYTLRNLALRDPAKVTVLPDGSHVGGDVALAGMEQHITTLVRKVATELIVAEAKAIFSGPRTVRRGHEFVADVIRVAVGRIFEAATEDASWTSAERWRAITGATNSHFTFHDAHGFGPVRELFVRSACSYFSKFVRLFVAMSKAASLPFDEASDMIGSGHRTYGNKHFVYVRSEMRHAKSILPALFGAIACTRFGQMGNYVPEDGAFLWGRVVDGLIYSYSAEYKNLYTRPYIAPYEKANATNTRYLALAKEARAKCRNIPSVILEAVANYPECNSPAFRLGFGLVSCYPAYKCAARDPNTAVCSAVISRVCEDLFYCASWGAGGAIVGDKSPLPRPITEEASVVIDPLDTMLDELSL